eukprot:m.71144 g.71144  ORF g.71144 m.71144 type:complete len:127 (-) comp24322_c2_seq5:1117-1497(-)
MVKNTYTSGRQAQGEGGWGENKPQDLEHIGETPYEYYGNMTTMNMNPLLLGNIKGTLYFRNLKDITTFDKLVDEIFYVCDGLTPWEQGTHSEVKRSGLCSSVRGVGTQGNISFCPPSLPSQEQPQK